VNSGHGYDLAAGMDLRRNFLRLLALGALVVAAIVVVVVVTTSLPDSDDGDGNRGARQQKTEEGPGDKYYFVQPGDSLSTIAEKEGIDLETLEQLNPDLDPQTLSAGQRVRLR
jgi:LysM repeat protein